MNRSPNLCQTQGTEIVHGYLFVCVEGGEERISRIVLKVLQKKKAESESDCPVEMEPKRSETMNGFHLKRQGTFLQEVTYAQTKTQAKLVQ